MQIADHFAAADPRSHAPAAAMQWDGNALLAVLFDDFAAKQAAAPR